MRPNFRTNESPIYFLGKIYNGKQGKTTRNDISNRLIMKLIRLEYKLNQFQF